MWDWMSEKLTWRNASGAAGATVVAGGAASTSFGAAVGTAGGAAISSAATAIGSSISAGVAAGNAAAVAQGMAATTTYGAFIIKGTYLATTVSSMCASATVIVPGVLAVGAGVGVVYVSAKVGHRVYDHFCGPSPVQQAQAQVHQANADVQQAREGIKVVREEDVKNMKETLEETRKVIEEQRKARQEMAPELDKTQNIIADLQNTTEQVRKVVAEHNLANAESHVNNFKDIKLLTAEINDLKRKEEDSKRNLKKIRKLATVLFSELLRLCDKYGEKEKKEKYESLSQLFMSPGKK